MRRRRKQRRKTDYRINFRFLLYQFIGLGVVISFFDVRYIPRPPEIHLPVNYLHKNNFPEEINFTYKLTILLNKSEVILGNKRYTLSEFEKKIVWPLGNSYAHANMLVKVAPETSAQQFVDLLSICYKHDINLNIQSQDITTNHTIQK